MNQNINSLLIKQTKNEMFVLVFNNVFKMFAHNLFL